MYHMTYVRTYLRTKKCILVCCVSIATIRRKMTDYPPPSWSRVLLCLMALSCSTCYGFVPSSSLIVVPSAISKQSVWLEARRRNNRYYYEDDDEDDEDDEYYYQQEQEEEERRRRRRRVMDDLNGKDGGLGVPSAFDSKGGGWRLPESVSQALLAGVFVLGIGTGVTVDSQINTSPKDLASRDAVDQAAPNPQLCTTMGASAMAFDQRVFVSFNPFNVYVAQADVKPACVLRPSNVVSVLQDQRHLLNEKEVRACKQNMNTWAFVGDLNDLPQLSCVYKSEDAQNEFLSNPKYGIGEDVYDDDRDAILTTRKLVKNEMTQAQQQQQQKAKMQALSKQSVFNNPSEILGTTTNNVEN